MLWQAAASAAALLTAPADAPPPRPMVMFVAIHRPRGDGGLYMPPDAGPDELPWNAYLRSQVQPFQTLSGRRRTGLVLLEYVGHAHFIPGVVMLVIAEPSRRGPGLFARWYTHRQDERGRYCVPEAVIAELGVERAFRRAAQVSHDGQAMRCIGNRFVTLDSWASN